MDGRLSQEFERKKVQHEVVNGLLEVLGQGLNDKRFCCLSKISKIEAKIMDIVLEDPNNTSVMSLEIIALVETFYNSFNDILKTHQKEEI